MPKFGPAVLPLGFRHHQLFQYIHLSVPSIFVAYLLSDRSLGFIKMSGLARFFNNFFVITSSGARKWSGREMANTKKYGYPPPWSKPQSKSQL